MNSPSFIPTIWRTAIWVKLGIFAWFRIHWLDRSCVVHLTWRVFLLCGSFVVFIVVSTDLLDSIWDKTIRGRDVFVSLEENVSVDVQNILFWTEILKAEESLPLCGILLTQTRGFLHESGFHTSLVLVDSSFRFVLWNSQLANFVPKRQCFFSKRHIWTLISTNRTHAVVSFVLQRHKCTVHCSTQKGNGLCAERNTDEGIKDNFLLFILLIQFAGCFWQRLVLCHRVLPTLQVLWWLHHLCGCLIDKTQIKTQTNLNLKALQIQPWSRGSMEIIFEIFMNKWVCSTLRRARLLVEACPCD